MSRETLRKRLEAADPLCVWRDPSGFPCDAEAEFHLPGDGHDFMAPPIAGDLPALLAVADAVADAEVTSPHSGVVEEPGEYMVMPWTDWERVRKALAALEDLP